MTTNGWHRKNTNTPAARARKHQYNSTEHKQHRRAGQAQVDAGTAHCWRCGTWLPPGSTWHVGHDDNNRNITRGTECVTCNLRTAARKGAHTVNARRTAQPQHATQRRSRTW